MVAINIAVVPLHVTTFHHVLVIFKSRMTRAKLLVANRLAPSLALMNIAALALIALLTLARPTTFPRLLKTLVLTLTLMPMMIILQPTCARHKVMSSLFARCIFF